MMWDFLLFVLIGPLVAFFVYYVLEDRKKSEKFLNQAKAHKHLVV